MLTGTLYTKYTRPPEGFEYNSGELLTDQAYMPVNQMVKAMMDAGVRYDSYKKEMYHFEADEVVPDDFVDLNQMKNIGPEDVQVLSESLVDRFERQIADAMKAQKEAEDHVDSDEQDDS